MPFQVWDDLVSKAHLPPARYVEIITNGSAHNLGSAARRVGRSPGPEEPRVGLAFAAALFVT